MKGELNIMNRTGHETVAWDTDAKTGPLRPEVAEARFAEMLRAGALAFMTDIETGENVATREFEPTQTQKITIAPRIAGGDR